MVGVECAPLICAHLSGVAPPVGGDNARLRAGSPAGGTENALAAGQEGHPFGMPLRGISVGADPQAVNPASLRYPSRAPKDAYKPQISGAREHMLASGV